jgi:SH3 domain protein
VKSTTLLVAILLCETFLWATEASAQASTVYISDKLTVPMRSGPSNAHRILHRGLPSGTRLEVVSVDEQAGFTQIRTERGTDGWIRSQYLVSQPIARDRLRDAKAEIQRLTRRIAQVSEQLASARSTGTNAQSIVNSLAADKKRLEIELAEVKRVSAGALEEHQENLQLESLNARLRAEVDDLVAANRRLESNLQERWLMIGGGLVFAGVIAGVAIKARPRRSGWS